jgi:pimeloyl-ACP methyl ester carboxylesterase
MDVYQLQLDELLNHLKIDKFILYGVSMGAPIAIQYSNNHIDRSLAVGIQVPVVHIDNNIFKILNVPIVGEMMMRFFGLPLIKKRALEWNKDESINEDFIEKYINQLSLPGTEHALLSASRNLFPKNYTSIYEAFSKNKIPFHIAYADDDAEVSPDSVRAIIKINNDADVFMFTGGHGGSAKIPDKIVNVFESFLSKNLNQ